MRTAIAVLLLTVASLAQGQALKKVPQKMRKYLEVSPMPNQMTAIGIIAVGER